MEMTVSFLSEAVRVLTSGGKERSQVLRGAAQGAAGGGEAGGKAGNGSAAEAEGVLRELQAALAEELALSLAVLRQEEEKAAEAAAGASNVSLFTRAAESQRCVAGAIVGDGVLRSAGAVVSLNVFFGERGSG